VEWDRKIIGDFMVAPGNGIAKLWMAKSLGDCGAGNSRFVEVDPLEGR
jgi:hypothetical protein